MTGEGGASVTLPPKLLGRVTPTVPVRSVLLAAPLIGLLVVWAIRTGGYQPDVWYPGVLVVAACLAVAIISTPLARLTSGARIALAALAAYAAWSFLSVTWAEDAADALEGSNRTLLYLLCFALFALLPWRTSSAVLVIAAFVVGVTVLGLGIMVRLATSSFPSDWFSGTRLSAPLGYQNANAAFWTIAAIPALLGAASRRVPRWLRAVLLGSTGLLLHLAVLSQSRGWLLTLPISLAVVVALHPDRRHLGVAAAVVAAVSLLAVPALVAVYRSEGQASAPAVNGAARVSLVATLALVAVGLLLTRIESRLSADARRPWAGAALVAVMVVGLGGAIVMATRVSTTTHFGDEGSDRSELWRVSLRLAADHPLTGLGQDNFGDPFLVQRRTDVASRWTHSFYLRLLVHTGMIGTLLFGVFVVAALVAAIGRGANPEAESRIVVLAALAPSLVWLLHGAVDWLWEFPVLSGAALAFLGLAVSVAHAGEEPGEVGPNRRVGRAWRAAGVVSVVVLGTVPTPQYLVSREVALASERWEAQPGQAMARLARAKSEDGRSARPDVTAGLIAIGTGDLSDARARFGSAIDREPSDWFPNFAMGLVATELGDRTTARAALERARRLNPREVVVLMALTRLGSADPLTFSTWRGELRAKFLEMTHLGGHLDYAPDAARPLTTR